MQRIQHECVVRHEGHLQLCVRPKRRSRCRCQLRSAVQHWHNRRCSQQGNHANIIGIITVGAKDAPSPRLSLRLPHVTCLSSSAHAKTDVACDRGCIEVDCDLQAKQSCVQGLVAEAAIERPTVTPPAAPRLCRRQENGQPCGCSAMIGLQSPRTK